MRSDTPESVDAYLAAVASDDARNSLLQLRAVIREAAPESEEVISYGIPTFKQKGMLCSYAAFKNHCSFFPGHTLAEFEDQLQGYKTSKGTIQFSPDKPLPKALVTAIVKSRLAENLAKKKK